ncbi:MAG: ComEC/Rec2 family competence protein [Clostridia bacterium]
MRRINLRPIVFIFIALCMGLYFSELIISLNALAICFSVILICLGILWSILPFFQKNKNAIVSNKEIQEKKRYNIKRAVTLALSIVSFVFAMFLPLMVCSDWDKFEANENNIVIQGEIDSSYIDGTSLQLVLKNVSLDFLSVPRRLSLSVWNKTKADYPVGSIIKFESTVENILLYDKGVFLWNYIQNIRYTANSPSSIEVVKFHTRLDEKIRLKVADILQKYMTSENAGIAFGALFGDKSQISDSTIRDFKQIGISHILAVSGMNVAFLCSILYLFLGLFKIKPKFKFAISLVVLLIYAWTCGFAPSVMRATLMSLCVLFAYVVGKQNDMLTTVSLSGLIITIINPLSPLDGGFLLSYACVFSMILLVKPLSGLLQKFLPGKRFCNSISVILAIQIGIFPLSIIYFNGVPILSILANFVCIPLFGLFYMLIVVFSLIVLFLPFMGFLFFIPDLIVLFVTKISSIIAEVPNSFLHIFHFDSILIVGFCVCLGLLSRFVNFSKKTKMFLSSLTAVVVCLFSLLYHIPPATTNGQVCFIYMPSGESTLIESSIGHYDLIDFGSGKSCNDKLDSFLHNKKVYKIDSIFVVNSSLANLSEEFLTKYYVEEVVIFGTSENSELMFENSYCKTRLIEKPYVSKDFTTFTFCYNSDFLGLGVTSFFKTIFFPSSQIDLTSLSLIENNFSNIEVFDARSLDFSLPNDFYNKQILPNPTKNSLDGLINQNDCWTINLSNVII